MMNLDDYIFAFLACIAIGIIIYIALTVRDIFNIFKQWEERR